MGCCPIGQKKEEAVLIPKEAKQDSPKKNSSIAHNCYKCKKELVGDISSIEGMSYHRSCFTCANCNKLLYNQQVVVLESKPYCDGCGMDRQLAELPTCFGCHKPLIGDCTEGCGHTYHVQCFNCIACKKNLTSTGHVPKNNQPYCPTCAKTVTK